MEKKLDSILFDNIQVTGIVGDYVFESIKKKQNYYEVDLLVKWTEYFKTAKCIFDIGANLGNHTMYWGRYTAAEKIYSFEPYKENFELLKNNVKNNSLENVIVVNKGVGEIKGYTTIKDFDEKNYGATTLNQEVSNEGEIEIVDIDSFCSENVITEIDFVKIDTEGFEEKVLEGMKTIISRCHPDVWVEVSKITAISVVNKMKEQGYILAEVSGCNLMFLYPERHPEVKEILSVDILEMMLNHLERANKFYKNYETAKQWHKNSLDKNEHLKKELEETKIICTEARGLLSIKEEECRLGEDKYRQQSEIVENLKTIGNQRELLISEYITWNERNKIRIEELEKDIELKETVIQEERREQGKKLLEQKKEYEEIILYQKEILSQQKAEIENKEGQLDSEIRQKEKYILELESCARNLNDVEKLLEEKKSNLKATEEKLACEINQKEKYVFELECCTKNLESTRENLEDCVKDLNDTKEQLKQKKTELKTAEERLVHEVSQKEKCILELQQCLLDLEEKKQILEELKICREEVSELLVKLECENVTQQKLKSELFACAEVLQEQATFLSELRQYIRKLETQNKYLTSENAECRRKLSIITDTKLGQFGLKVYHLLKRIYRKLFRK